MISSVDESLLEGETSMRALPLAGFVFLLFNGPVGAAVLRVAANAPGPTHDGAAWPTAFTGIQPALDAAKPGDEVWVAAGTYAGDLTLATGVALYGGFRGDETTRSQRDVAAHESAASGRRITVPRGATVTLDGISLINGDYLTATDASVSVRDCTFAGGGIIQTGGSLTLQTTHVVGGAYGHSGVLVSDASVAITDNTIRRGIFEATEYGSGYVARLYSGGLSLTDCRGEIAGNTIEDNHLDVGTTAYTMGGGAGLCATRGVLVIRRNRITGNTATISGNTALATGGGVYCENGTFVISDNLIAGNSVSAVGGAASGGGVYIVDSSALLVNNTIAGNRTTARPNNAVSGGGLCLVTHPSVQGRYVVENNIIAFNDTGADWHGVAPEWTDNDVFGNGQDYPPAGPDLTGTAGNISRDPLFLDAASGDYHLRSYSPVINAGDDLAVRDAYDLDGAFRILGAHVDMGAYETQPAVRFTMGDVARALRIAAGITAADNYDRSYAHAPQGQPSSITVADAVDLARQVAGPATP
jgi:hypothetical protein